mgnify:CR=1 FL=1
MEDSPFTQAQIDELNKPLAPSATKQRKSGGGLVRYIEGHTAIDTANRIFGYGNWGYHLDELAQVVILDPISGEGIGVEYRAIVTVAVRGALPITDVGSQPVAVCSVEEQCWARRLSDAKYHKKPVDEAPLTDYERKQARSVIMESHEMAKKGAVTDALKRCLRALGNQFGNSLYGDDRAAASPGNANISNGANVTPILSTAEKMAKLRQQAIEQGLLEAAQFETFKAEKLGAPVDDSAITQQQYGVLFNALKALQTNRGKQWSKAS